MTASASLEQLRDLERENRALREEVDEARKLIARLMACMRILRTYLESGRVHISEATIDAACTEADDLLAGF